MKKKQTKTTWEEFMKEREEMRKKKEEMDQLMRKEIEEKKLRPKEEREKEEEEEEEKRISRMFQTTRFEYYKVIQMSITDYLSYFDDIKIDHSYEDTLTNHNETLDIILQHEYTIIKIEYKGIVQIIIPEETENPMIIQFESTNENTVCTQYTYPREEKESLMKEYISTSGKTESVEIVIKRLSDENETNPQNRFEMIIKSDKEIETSIEMQIQHEMKEMKEIEDERVEKYGKCEFCQDGFEKEDEKMIVKNWDKETIYCHRECYQYVRCSQCRRKHINPRDINETEEKYPIKRMLYMRNIKGYICEECQEFIIDEYVYEKDEFF